MDRKAAIAALQWHLEAGADEALTDEPVDSTALPSRAAPAASTPATPLRQAIPEAEPAALPGMAATTEARAKALDLARAADSLDELAAAIAGFDGLAIKKTAKNIVFADGNPRAAVMVVGEAPGADEDRLGKPFVGVSGQLLDLMLAAAGLERGAEDPAKAVYISNILNWRPPGNRTPSPAEIEISLPFIEKHIALVKPRLLLFAGGVSTKALLGSESSISKLRGRLQSYAPLTPGLFDTAPAAIPVIATYHPSYLLRTPAHKKQAWQDLLLLGQQRRELGLL